MSDQNKGYEIEELIYRLSVDSVLECFDDGALILNLKDLTLIELNPTARDILKLTDGNKNAQELAHCLANEYEISQEVALQDVIELYQTLVAQGIIEVSKPSE